MKKTLVLFCAVLGFFAFTAFDWENKSTQEQENKAPAPAVAPSGDPVTALNQLLGNGTPAERQAKLDNIIRLSQVMSKMQPGAVAAAGQAVSQQAPKQAPAVAVSEPVAKQEEVATEAEPSATQDQGATESDNQSSGKRKGFWNR